MVPTLSHFDRIRIRLRVYAYAEKPCIRYTGVRVDGWFHFVRFHLYTKSVVPSVYDGTVCLHAPPGINPVRWIGLYYVGQALDQLTQPEQNFVYILPIAPEYLCEVELLYFGFCSERNRIRKPHD